MRTREALKETIHRGIRRFGFDVVSVKNLDAALDKRKQERKQRHLAEIARIRATHDSSHDRLGTSATRHGVGEVVWVKAEELEGTACALLQAAHTILDIGCAFHPQRYVDANVHICCEPCKEYMDRLVVETVAAGKYVYLDCDIENAARIFPAFSVDSVFLVDVIEHVEREAALKCLDRLKRISRQQIVLFTPVGYMDQEPLEDNLDAWGMGGAEWQRHKSGWTPEDFPVTDGWQVVACREYHTVDAYGRKLDTPIGAMWAIWNRQ